MMMFGDGGVRKNKLALKCALTFGIMLFAQAYAADTNNSLAEKPTPAESATSNPIDQKKQESSLIKDKYQSQEQPIKHDHHARGVIKIEGQSHSRRLTDDSLYKPPYPFSADELWARILKVISSPKAHVSTAQVENIFNISLPQNAKSDNPSSHLAKQGQDWYFNIKVDELSATRSSFRLDWGADDIYTADPLPDDICLVVGKKRQEIEQFGWKFLNNFYTPPPGGLPEYFYFRKGKRAVLRIGFDMLNHCISEIAMYSDVDDMSDDAFNTNNRKLFKEN